MSLDCYVGCLDVNFDCSLADALKLFSGFSDEQRPIPLVQLRLW